MYCIKLGSEVLELSQGYNVADYMEMVEFFAIPWADYFEGRITIGRVLVEIDIKSIELFE